MIILPFFLHLFDSDFFKKICNGVDCVLLKHIHYNSLENLTTPYFILFVNDMGDLIPTLNNELN